MMIIEFTNQVIHNAIAHHPLTDAHQPVPRQQSPAPPPAAPSLYAEHDVVWYGISLRPAGLSCPGCIPAQLLVHPLSPCWRGCTSSWRVPDL